MLYTRHYRFYTRHYGFCTSLCVFYTRHYGFCTSLCVFYTRRYGFCTSLCVFYTRRYGFCTSLCVFYTRHYGFCASLCVFYTRRYGNCTSLCGYKRTNISLIPAHLYFCSASLIPDCRSYKIKMSLYRFVGMFFMSVSQDIYHIFTALLLLIHYKSIYAMPCIMN